MKRTIVIIGGAHGGSVSAARLRQFDEAAHIILVEESSHITWVQADLRFYLETDLIRLEKFLSEKEYCFVKDFNIDVRLNTKATILDMDSKLVVLECQGVLERVNFNAVIFAAGSFSKGIDIEGLQGSYVSHFSSFEDILKIKKAIHQGAKKAVVLGCGFYGIEAAQGLKTAGLSVEIVEKAPRILPCFSLPTARAIVHKLQEQEISIHLADCLVYVHAKRNFGFDLHLASEKVLSADIVIVAVGNLPRAKLLEDAGAALQKDGSVRVDEQMLTTLPSVYACGSAVSVLQATTHERIWISGPSAVERTAQIAGYNAAMIKDVMPEIFKPFTDTKIICVNNFCFAKTGLTLTEARKCFGEAAVFSSTVHSQAKEAWIKRGEIMVNLIVDRPSRLIVGGEVWGETGVSSRIDMISVAITEKWSPNKLIDLDMAYAPLLGPVLDPLKEAGTMANMSLLEKNKSMPGETLALWIAQQRMFTLIDVSKRQSQNSRWPSHVEYIQLENLREQIHSIKKNRPIIISSRLGRRAFLAHRILLQLGYSEVYHLDGGELSWSLMVGAGYVLSGNKK
jgi:NADPH-dependent 2,4-dienoyl-CoA reductase/sulfur reductase-like enzyme/rhodanese-related sulfurtransferase